MAFEATNPGKLREVQLSTLSPVMWAEGRTYPRATMSVPIHPYDPSLGGLGSCCGGRVPYWNRSNSIANLRPIGMGAEESFWSSWPMAFLISASVTVLVLALMYGPPVPWTWGRT
jgi:hypothetical protein